MTDILAAGNLAPPVHGQSLATERMIALFREQGFTVAVHDIGPSDVVKSRLLRRVRRHMVAAWAILCSRAPLAYLPVNNGSAMVLTILLCMCARLSGKAVVFHHHSLSYVTQPSSIMRMLVRVAGNRALHIVQSDTIGGMMAGEYGLDQYLGYSNVGIVEHAEGEDREQAGVSGGTRTGITLGYLANVTAEKGAYVLLDAFATLRETRDDVRLIMAGPCHDAAIRATIAAYEERFGPDMRWLGPVYAGDKQVFFESLDIFVFPTLYPTETQGMVNLEAMREGVAVVAFDRGRIGEDIGTDGGIAVPVGSDFTSALRDFVARYRSDMMRPMVRGRYDELLQEHSAEKSRLLDWMQSHTGRSLVVDQSDNVSPRSAPIK